MDKFSFSPIGYVASCYKEKFSIPRQPRLVSEATSSLRLTEGVASDEIIRGLEGFSHIWLVFVFHAIPSGQWKPTVRPPRLGGNTRLGVFATRSTNRPNPIGMSAVELLDIERISGEIRINLGSCDLLDGTPVLDIKPYIPYADSIPQAQAGFARQEPDRKLQVLLTEKSEMLANEASQRLGVNIPKFIEQILSMDPRPSYQAGQFGERVYAAKVYDFDLQWRYLSNDKIEVIDLLVMDDVK